jgi:hypothetical protein
VLVDDTKPITVVEMPEFIRQSARLFDDGERHRLVDFLATHPMVGDLIQGTGGLRKLRWSASSRGKRGGARVIYYYHDPDMPLFALTVFAKNEKADLSHDDRELFRQLVEVLVKHYRKETKR